LISSYYNSIVPTAHSNWWSIIFITMYDVVRSKSQDIRQEPKCPGPIWRDLIVLLAGLATATVNRDSTTLASWLSHSNLFLADL